MISPDLFLHSITLVMMMAMNVMPETLKKWEQQSRWDLATAWYDLKVIALLIQDWPVYVISGSLLTKDNTDYNDGNECNAGNSSYNNPKSLVL